VEEKRPKIQVPDARFLLSDDLVLPLLCCSNGTDHRFSSVPRVPLSRHPGRGPRFRRTCVPVPGGSSLVEAYEQGQGRRRKQVQQLCSDHFRDGHSVCFWGRTPGVGARTVPPLPWGEVQLDPISAPVTSRKNTSAASPPGPKTRLSPAMSMPVSDSRWVGSCVNRATPARVPVAPGLALSHPLAHLLPFETPSARDPCSSGAHQGAYRCPKPARSTPPPPTPSDPLLSVHTGPPRNPRERLAGVGRYHAPGRHRGRHALAPGGHGHARGTGGPGSCPGSWYSSLPSLLSPRSSARPRAGRPGSVHPLTQSNRRPRTDWAPETGVRGGTGVQAPRRPSGRSCDEAKTERGLPALGALTRGIPARCAFAPGDRRPFVRRPPWPGCRRGCGTRPAGRDASPVLVRAWPRWRAGSADGREWRRMSSNEPNDTHPKIEALLIQGYRRMSSAGKLGRVRSLTRAVQEPALLDIRRRHPNGRPRAGTPPGLEADRVGTGASGLRPGRGQERAPMLAGPLQVIARLVRVLDTLLHKMVWYPLGGRISDRQRQDFLGAVKVAGGTCPWRSPAGISAGKGPSDHLDPNAQLRGFS